MLWWKNGCWLCDGSGESTQTEPYCPRHPYTWDMPMPKQRFPTVSGSKFPVDRTCFRCHNTHRVVQWGILVACPACRPLQYQTDMRTKFPPPGYF